MFLEMAARRRRKGGAGATFDPISLFTAGGGSGTGRLYDFKVASTLFADAGVTQANVGDFVYRIADRTSGGNADQPTASFQGVRRVDGIELDGTDDFYPTGLNVPGANFTVVTSVAVDAAAAASAMLLGQQQTASIRLMNYLLTVSTFGFAAQGSARSVAVDVRNTTVFSVLLGQIGIGVTGFLNGTSYAVEPTPNLGGVTMHWGCRNNAGTAGNFLRGRLRGLLIINRSLTPSELTSVQTYWS